MNRFETSLDLLSTALGAANVIREPGEMAAYLTDWTGRFTGQAIAVIRPASTDEVVQVVNACADADLAITPQGGNTGIEGGSIPSDDRPSVVLSLERMRAIRELNISARTATVEAGVVLQTLRDVAAEHQLTYPVTFGSRGSCTLGGNLATNAGGSNVVRYGNTRDLCFGIEAVMADGSVVNDLTGLRKDNTGYDLRHLLIGSEGTLGIITAGVMQLVPLPRAYATAFLSVPDLPTAITLLNSLQDATGGQVEAFEYMPECMVNLICSHHPSIRPPVTPVPVTGVLVEIGSTRDADCEPLPDGRTPLVVVLESLLERMFDDGLVLDATVATSEQQRRDFWHMRESALEAVTGLKQFKGMDIAMPIERVTQFVERASLLEAEHRLRSVKLAHLGDGNLHYVLTARDGETFDEARVAACVTKIYDLVQELNGSIAAEHGIGQAKRDLLAERKDRATLNAMHKIKSSLDPRNIMNPGKVL